MFEEADFSPAWLLDAGHALRAARGETACGDAALVVATESGAVVALVDGLGHGAAAAEAAAACVESFRENLHGDLPAMFAAAHQRLRGTRGAVAAVARVRPSAGEAELAGLGNITVVRAGASLAAGGRRLPIPPGEMASGSLVLPRTSVDRSTVPVGVPGVLGGSFHKVRVERVPFEPGDLLLLHTDGVEGPVSTLPLRLLSAREAATEVIAAHGSPDDDAGCVVVRALTVAESEARAATSRLRDLATQAPAQRRVSLRIDGDAQIAAFEARRLATQLGMSGRAQWEVGIAAAELATNVLKYGVEGTLTLRHAPPPDEALVIEVTDRGEGLVDLEGRTGDGGRSIRPRAPGMGLGVGLGSVYRLMDEVDVQTVVGSGTRVVARKRFGG